MEPSNLTDNSSECPSIDDFRNQVYSTSYSLITVLGLTGNLFALVVLIKTNRRNSPFDVYMLNLGVSDLLFVMTLPLRVLYYARKGHWALGDFLCRVTSYAFYVNLYCSIYFMVAMSLTRFLAIVFPVRNMQLVTVGRARLTCGGIWVLICLLSSPFLLSGQSFDPSTNKTKCYEPPRGPRVQKLLVMSYLSLVVGFILPFLVILVCYAGIIRALLSRSKATRQRQQATGTRAIRMIVIVLLTFLVSFTPYHVQRTLHLSLDSSNSTCPERIAMQKSVVVTLALAATNSCFDPLLYFFSGEGFRSRLLSLRQSVTSLPKSSRLRRLEGPEAEENHQQQRAG